MYHSPKQSEAEVRELAAHIYAEKRSHLLRIANRNAATAADAEEALQDTFASFISEFDIESPAPALAWITLCLKRRCWRLRDAAHLDRRIGPDPEGDHEQPTALIDRLAGVQLPIAELVAERDEARRRLHRLKPDERTAIGMVAAGCSYREVGEIRGWTLTKTNRCLYEGRKALVAGVAP